MQLDQRISRNLFPHMNWRFVLCPSKIMPTLIGFSPGVLGLTSGTHCNMLFFPRQCEMPTMRLILFLPRPSDRPKKLAKTVSMRCLYAIVRELYGNASPRVAFAFREYLLGIYGYFYGLFLHKQGLAWPMIIIDPTSKIFWA